MVVTIDDVRRLAVTPPRTTEALVRDRVSILCRIGYGRSGHITLGQETRRS